MEEQVLDEMNETTIEDNENIEVEENSVNWKLLAGVGAVTAVAGTIAYKKKDQIKEKIAGFRDSRRLKKAERHLVKAAKLQAKAVHEKETETK